MDQQEYLSKALNIVKQGMKPKRQEKIKDRKLNEPRVVDVSKIVQRCPLDYDITDMSHMVEVMKIKTKDSWIKE